MTRIIDIAQTILDGFDKHYRLFRATSAEAKQRFERADWGAVAAASRQRIPMYDERVREAVSALLQRFPEAACDESLWPRIKIIYIGLLHEHRQPECAETFYNSVACRVLHRQYYHNTYIFWRPAISTEHLEGEEPTYHCHYPGVEGLRRSLLKIATGCGLANPFHNLRHDIRHVLRAFEEHHTDTWRAHANHQLQTLGSLFYRNKAAYIVGREINGAELTPFVMPVLQNERGELYIDTALFDAEDVSVVFSFSHAYFMVDTEVPSAYVSYLHSILPGKPVLELYAMLGLQKQSKTMFYRELHHHLKYSTDNFIVAAGIRGMVMLVFTLPSFPFVFKIIRDVFAPPKDISRDDVKAKYQLVKNHDRVGRLADTLEYSHVAIPLARVDPVLLAELRNEAASNFEIDGENLILKHVYIERRMTPLNEYLPRASEPQRCDAIYEYGNAIRDLAGANIFPGDMMLKNFGVTRHNRVVFYDYDEICYLTECKFRRLPPAPADFDEMSAEPWYSVELHDVFPELFRSFFFSDPQSRAIFYRHHRSLIEPAFWTNKQHQIRTGQQPDVFPYRESLRFCNRYPLTVTARPEADTVALG